MIVVRFDDPQEYHAPEQTARRARVFINERKIGRKDIAVGMSIYGQSMEAPFHMHKGSETIFIVHGKGRFGTKSEEAEVGAGDVLYFKANEEHFLKNIGSQTLEFVFIYSSPGDEKPIEEKWVPLTE